MFRHVSYVTKDGSNVIAPITNPPNEFSFFTIPNGSYLQSILKIINPNPLGKGSTGRVYKAIMSDLSQIPCVIKLHKDLIDTPQQYMCINNDGQVIVKQPTSQQDSSRFTQVFKAVVQEFKQEVEFSIRLTLGSSVFSLHITETNMQPVAMGLWTDVQSKMQAQFNKPGYNCLHHIMEFDLYTIPCIISRQCNGDLLHLPIIAPEYIPIIWKILLSDILQGIRFMHNENIAHNDLKPANVFYMNMPQRSICPFQALVADFGMCTPANDKIYVDFGTEAYACPEISKAFKTPKSQTHYSSADTKVMGIIPHNTKVVPDTIPKENDAFAFAKTGLVLWEKFQRPGIDEKDLVKIVNGYLFQNTDLKSFPFTNDLHAYLLAICKAETPSIRYALFEKLQIQ